MSFREIDNIVVWPTSGCLNIPLASSIRELYDVQKRRFRCEIRGSFGRSGGHIFKEPSLGP